MRTNRRELALFAPAQGDIDLAESAAVGAGRDRSLEPSAIEPWLWGLGLFLLTSPFVFQLTGTDPSNELSRSMATFRRAEGSSTYLYLLRFIVAAAAMTSIAPFWREAIARLYRMTPILLFTGWAALSLSWSDTFTSSLNGLFALLPLLITGFCLALRLPPHMFARSLVYSGAFMAGFSLLYVFVFPHFGIHQASDASQSVHAGNWRGVYPHKNILGGITAAYAVVTILSGRAVVRSTAFRLSLFAVLMLIIVKSGSATALGIVFVAPCIAWFAVCLNWAQRGLVLAVLTPVAFGIYAGLDQIVGLLGRDLTFTGRTEIWAIVPETLGRRPLTGYGFASTTYGDFMIQLFKRFNLFDPHNGYLNLVLSTGFVGLGLFLASLLSMARVARRIYLAGDEAAHAALAVFGITSAWMVACCTESQDKPLGTFAALGFTCFGLFVYREHVRAGTARR